MGSDETSVTVIKGVKSPSVASIDKAAHNGEALWLAAAAELQGARLKGATWPYSR